MKNMSEKILNKIRCNNFHHSKFIVDIERSSENDIDYMFSIPYLRLKTKTLRVNIINNLVSVLLINCQDFLRNINIRLNHNLPKNENTGEFNHEKFL